jgi:hypothetical protein
MSANERDLVEQIHRGEIERLRQKKAKERALVEAMFQQALERPQAQEESSRALVEAVHREAFDPVRRDPPPVERPREVHYSELLEAKPGEPLAAEWNTYRREVGRLLSDGQAGRHVLIKGEQIIGTFDTSEAAYEAGWKHYPHEPFFVHAIRAEEPSLRIRGVNVPWPSSLTR